LHITRKKLKKIIVEQFSQEQIDKLEILLRSDDEVDVRQGLSIARALLDEGGSDDYPEIANLFYSVAADKDAKIQALRTRRSKYENNRIKLSNRIMELSRQIYQHKHPSSHPDVIKLRREMTHLLNRKIDVLDYIELADADLDRLLNNYRIFEEFPITMGGSSGGSVVVQDPMMESKKIKSVIMEQLDQENLSKLERLLRSNNEEDFRQGLQIASTLLDSGGYEDYPQLNKLYYDIATEKDEKIQAKIKSIRKIKKEQAQVAGDVAKLTKEIQHFEKEMRELGYDERADQLTSIALQAAGFHSLKKIHKEMRKDLRYLKNKNRDLVNYIDIAESDLERLLSDYRTLENFPIYMGDDSRGTVVVQDPMMESTRKYVEKKINDILKG